MRPSFSRLGGLAIPIIRHQMQWLAVLLGFSGAGLWEQEGAVLNHKERKDHKAWANDSSQHREHGGRRAAQPQDQAKKWGQRNRTLAEH